LRSSQYLELFILEKLAIFPPLLLWATKFVAINIFCASNLRFAVSA